MNILVHEMVLSDHLPADDDVNAAVDESSLSRSTYGSVKFILTFLNEVSGKPETFFSIMEKREKGFGFASTNEPNDDASHPRFPCD